MRLTTSPFQPLTTYALLLQGPYIQAVEVCRPNTIKQLPLRVINSTVEDAFAYLQSILDGSPGAVTSAVLHQLWLQTQALTVQLLPHLRPNFHVHQSDSVFRLLEYFEARVEKTPLQN